MKTYIQIGTNNGDDDFFKLVSDLTEKTNIILIEPQSDLIPIIESNYKGLMDKHNITILNNGVVHDKTINSLYKYDETTNGVLSSVIHRKSYDSVVDSINFEPITISEICEKYKIDKIDLLFIDTEGYDYTIINSLDLDKLNITEIICEIWPYDIDSNDIIVTGPTYFNDVIIPKLNDYTLIKYDCCNYKFTKKI
jgi:FkbM family methyltransferase